MKDPEEIRKDAAAELYSFIESHPGKKKTTPQEVLFFLAVLREITVLHSNMRPGGPYKNDGGKSIDTTTAEFQRGYAAGVRGAIKDVYIGTFSDFCDDPRLYGEVKRAVDIFINSYPPGEDAQTVQLETAAILNAIFTEAERAEELATAYNLPTGPLADAFLEILAAGSDLRELPERKKRISHSAQYEVLVDNDDTKRQRITKETVNEYLIFETDDINEYTGTNTPAKNLFILSLIEANRQAIINGTLTRDFITFPLQTLVDNGSYSDLRAARRGFIQGLRGITKIRVSGFIIRGKEKQQVLRNAGIEVLFTGGNITNNNCTVFLNPRISWGVVAPYFSILPKYYFKLPNRAKDLLYYIFYLARQNTEQIKEKGYFTVSFKAIHSRLDLPFENETEHPQRDIVEAIENALEAIEEENKAIYKDGQFNLFPIYPKPKKGRKRISATEFIEEGKLKVSLSGELAEQFEKLSDQKTKKIQTAQKKAARIEEKAAAIKKAKLP